MTLPMSDHSYLDDVTPDRLAALILELASQLHVERQRRIALETLLTRNGVIGDEIDGLAGDAEIGEKGRAALDQSMRRMLRIMTEAGDPRRPL
ncbi:hypothetical protein P1X14_09810 [Sphingomonas sp. AOB5]|uniref:hypothetical protein n=1 Tax=Sphingomonas sp. AOB5 TaxID=3034017 RepID=UPI0023F95C2B|nr:hypothetical protein [Sphingomonas sp. AOB5]MDF7775540.1 hypothetical protein [Sphingomonas sp. AOB5]